MASKKFFLSEVAAAIVATQQQFAKAPLSFLNEREIQGYIYSELIQRISTQTPHKIRAESDLKRYQRAPTRKELAGYGTINLGSAVHMESLAYDAKDVRLGKPDIYVLDPGFQPVYVQVDKRSAKLEVTGHDYPTVRRMLGIEVKMYLWAPADWLKQKKRRDSFLHDVKKLSYCNAGWFVLATTNRSFKDVDEWRRFFASIKKQAPKGGKLVRGCYLCPELGSNPWIVQ